MNDDDPKPLSEVLLQKKTIFGVVANGELLYETLQSNPRRAVRFYDRLKRPIEEARLIRFNMRRVHATRRPDKNGEFDLQRLLHEQLSGKKGRYIGPMK